MVSSYL